MTTTPTTPQHCRRSLGQSDQWAHGGRDPGHSHRHHLTGATAVHFGSTPGTGITGVTATSLTVTSPAGTGTVDVTVTTPNGTSAVNAPGDQFTYNAPALPTVTSVSPTNGPAAAGPRSRSPAPT